MLYEVVATCPQCEQHHVFHTLSDLQAVQRIAHLLNEDATKHACLECHVPFIYGGFKYGERPYPQKENGEVSGLKQQIAQWMEEYEGRRNQVYLQERFQWETYSFYLYSDQFDFYYTHYGVDYADMAQVDWNDEEGLTVQLGTNGYPASFLQSLTSRYECLEIYESYDQITAPEDYYVFKLSDVESLLPFLQSLQGNEKGGEDA